jgi:hypothetical protein
MGSVADQIVGRATELGAIHDALAGLSGGDGRATARWGAR